MKTFKSHLKETTLSRVFRHFQNKNIPVGIITAFRDEYDYKKNVKRNFDHYLTFYLQSFSQK